MAGGGGQFNTLHVQVVGRYDPCRRPTKGTIRPPLRGGKHKLHLKRYVKRNEDTTQIKNKQTNKVNAVTRAFLNLRAGRRRHTRTEMSKWFGPLWSSVARVPLRYKREQNVAEAQEPTQKDTFRNH